MVKVSVIVTVFNEQESILDLLSALHAQTRKPDEIVIVDAESTDNTWNILKQNANKHKNLKIYQKPGIRSIGRNYAMSMATGNILALTDAGCIPEKNWLSEIVKPFADPKVEVVCGYYKGLPKNVFEKSLVPYVLVMPDKTPDQFFPSSRSMALRKSVLKKYGQFNEDLDPSEDFEYATRLHNQGVVFVFAKDAVVGWIPRKDLKDAWWMFLRFATGDILANIYRPKVKQLAIRYTAFFYLCSLSIQVPVLLPLVPLCVIIYCLWAIKKNYKYVNQKEAFIWLPLLQITADIAVLLGTIIGFLYKMGSPSKKV